MNYIISSRNRQHGEINDAEYDIRIPKNMQSTDKYSISLSLFSSSNSCFKFNCGDYITMTYGETTTTLTIDDSNKGSYDDFDSYAYFINETLTSLLIDKSDETQLCTLSYSSEFSISMTRASANLFGFESLTLSDATSYTGDTIVDETPIDLMKISFTPSNQANLINPEVISIYTVGDEKGNNPPADELAITYSSTTKKFSITCDASDPVIKHKFPDLIEQAPSIFAILSLKKGSITRFAQNNNASYGVRTSFGLNTIYIQTPSLPINDFYTKIPNYSRASDEQSSFSLANTLAPLYRKRNKISFPSTTSILHYCKGIDWLKNLKIRICDSEGQLVNVPNYTITLVLF